MKNGGTTLSNCQRFPLRLLVLTGMLGAVSALLMILEFPVPFVPPFVKFDLSELPVILSGCMMGPVAGAFAAVIKVALNFLLNGTTTMGIGEMANLWGSLCYVVPAALFYGRRHTKSAAVRALLLGTLCASALIVLGNYFAFFPAYARLLGMKMETIIAMGHAANAAVTNLCTLMICALLPFNLFKYGVTSLLAFVMYKRLKQFLRFPVKERGQRRETRGE